MEIRNRVREFIESNFYVADPAMVGDECSLLDQGIVDSTGVLEVIAFIEREFGLHVPDREVLPENLGSIAAIVSYIDRHSQRPTG
jgi:acyl carrier protein